MNEAVPGAGLDMLLLLDPRGRDAEVVSRLLLGIAGGSRVCAGLDDLAASAGDDRVGLALVAEETLRGRDLGPLRAALAAQPPWSDLPFVVLTRGPGSPREDPYAVGLADALGNAVFLERPVRAATLTAAARSALRARRRQLQLRDHLAERDAAARRQAMLMHELNHRVKNSLATVQGIAAQTIRGDADPEAARRAFLARLLALAKTHDLLTATAWTGSALRDVILAELAPFGDEASPGRVTLEGPEVRLAPNATVAIGMAIHELATNAVKYGALSVPGGRVVAAWSAAPAPRPGDRRQLHLTWTERGGPRVAPPTRRGFGSRLIERGLARELGGTVHMDFAPEGLRCAVDVPLPDDLPIEMPDAGAPRTFLHPALG
ncbi:sensor histidine kinase [Falsiroseomonas sp. HW251]|uniref:sensor histidine kinase n=1 Tax=Falsiroseomonas sp. HW251 TaxID=3390998 RepID=UPI003D31C723